MYTEISRGAFWSLKFIYKSATPPPLHSAQHCLCPLCCTSQELSSSTSSPPLHYSLQSNILREKNGGCIQEECVLVFLPPQYLERESLLAAV
ncbi:hypothetical protein L1887_08178 [Cichorium endivia]|nr:hypothetical protein L1887_08178 [Cichorium endivia]